MQETLDGSFTIDNSRKKRSTLITILCILTWVGSIWYFLMAIYGIFTLEYSVKAIRMLYNTVQLSPIMPDYVTNMLEMVDRYVLLSRIHQAVTLINAVTCVWGAVLMWHRKRSGYFIYLFGQLPYLVSGALVYWAGNEIPLIGSIGGIITMFSLIMVVVFTLLYTFRLKNLI